LTAKCKQGANLTRGISAIFLAALILSIFQRTAYADETRNFIALDYEILLNGLPVADLQVDASLGRHSYDLSSTLWTRGVMDIILGFKSIAHAQGRIESAPGKLIVGPETHGDDNVWMEEERKVRIVYGPVGPIKTHVSPLPANEGRDEVSAELRRDTRDLLSAALQLSLLAQDGSVCESHNKVFDGRRRYDLIFSPGEIEGAALTSEGSHGSVFLCDGKLVRLAGRSAEPWLPRSKAPKEFQLWMNQIDPDLPPVPFRLKAFSGIGWLVAQLATHSREPRSEETETVEEVAD